MRVIAGAVGGILMALGLFYLLALLVAPPEDNREPIEQPMSVSRVEAPEAQQASAPEAAAPDAPTPPAQTPPPPPPSPVPAAQSDSSLTLPEPEASAPPSPEVPEESLPELEEVEPTPEPEPEPAPEPDPEPEPQPDPQPDPEPAQETSPSDAASQGDSGETADTESSASGETSEQDAEQVGSPQPTERVPPEYPSRAQRRGIEGFVEVSFTIMPNGQVDRDSLHVTDAEPRSMFERAALKAVADWRFPQSDQPREARQRLEFRLKR
ncbi:outer membrane transport energization protein TonB [Chromohalobacter canadensis]|uniref:Protein TonB n=1 Tax=Chromohalobacter canadensis TaxID=141389 RepID=A0A285VQ20_9GAMM|nr:energy transducer TonB [Chromohalobacter canadensis]SOC56159.1 outer membrane transport energization protein TonB [Chromohalobacter canadensis]